MPDAPDSAAIEARLHGYADAWAENSAAALEGFWDVDDPSPFYLAEEIETPITDWPGLRAYWAGNERLHARISLRLSDIRLRALSEGLVQGVLRMDWDIAFLSGPSRAMGGDNRVAVLLRRDAQSWRLTSWVEAPLAPITYMRRLYEGRVTPGFAEAPARELTS